MTENKRTLIETIEVQGYVAPGFEEIRDAFESNFTEGEEVGASLAIYRDGQPVIDIWAGQSDPVQGRDWTADTVTLVYSATKGATSILLHRLAELEQIDLDAPVAFYWPEFASNGKEAITVRQLLSHQAGLPVPEKQLSREELFLGKPASDALAAQQPLWEPGTIHGYHPLTFGWLMSELVVRATGNTVSELFTKHIVEPLGLTFWIGLPDDVRPEYAPLLNGNPDLSTLHAIDDPAIKNAVLGVLEAMGDPDSLFARALSTNGALPTPDGPTWNSREALRNEQPAANGVTNARSLAKMYAATVSEVDGVRLLQPETVESARTELVYGPDKVVLNPTRFGTGFMLDHPGLNLLGPTSFGHEGAGGALGFGDVENRLGFGYAQNQLSSSLIGEVRTRAIVDALRKCL